MTFNSLFRNGYLRIPSFCDRVIAQKQMFSMPLRRLSQFDGLQKILAFNTPYDKAGVLEDHRSTEPPERRKKDHRRKMDEETEKGKWQGTR